MSESEPPYGENDNIPLDMIVSGGQTGADRGGLDAALALSIPHGGWCPKGRLSEDGKIPMKYMLHEVPTKDYLKRTEMNVIDSHATIVFTHGPPSGGSKRTVDFARKHGKPCLCVDMLAEPTSAVRGLSDWLTARTGETRDLILNVAGSRESKAPGIQDAVRDMLIEAIVGSAPVA